MLTIKEAKEEPKKKYEWEEILFNEINYIIQIKKLDKIILKRGKNYEKEMRVHNYRKI